MNHTVSVVIPTYNRARFLSLAIGSVRAQTRAVDEIVVVDDGSTDDTEAAARRLGADIRYVRQGNAGPAAARNRGIDIATGSLIAFLDTDDCWLPGKTEKQLAALAAFPEAALVSADMAGIDEAGKLLYPSGFERHRVDPEVRRSNGAPVPHALRRILKTNFINTSTVLVKKAVLDEVGAFNSGIRFGEDLELWARIAARHPIITLPEVLEHRTEHDRNVTKNIEPLLLDLVKVATTIRAWGAQRLSAEGVDADRLVAQACADLGYWYFSTDRLAEARKAFGRSLRESPSVRAGAYGALSLLPTLFISRLRALKQRLRPT